jgi:hypothetical protein
MTDTSPADVTPASEPNVQVALAEFSALRAEIERRAGVQWNVFALQVTTAGAISSVALSRASNAALLLLIPLSSYMFGSRYILHDHYIKLIHGYIRGSLSPSLAGRLGWERWRDNAAPIRSGRLFTPTDWRWTHPTRLAFEGIGTLALIGSGLAAVGTWPTNRPPWYQIAAFSFLFAFGLLVTVFLHRSFTSGQTSSTAHEQRP